MSFHIRNVYNVTCKEYLYSNIHFYERQSPPIAAELQVIFRCRLPKDNGKFEGCYIFFPLLPKYEAYVCITPPFKRHIKWMCMFTVITKLQENFLFRGFGDKTSISGNNLWCSTSLGNCHATESSHLFFPLCTHLCKQNENVKLKKNAEGFGIQRTLCWQTSAS